jgi:hypothetical protein
MLLACFSEAASTAARANSSPSSLIISLLYYQLDYTTALLATHSLPAKNDMSFLKRIAVFPA